MLYGKNSQKRTLRATAVEGRKVCQPLGLRRRKPRFSQNTKSSVLGWGMMFLRQLAPCYTNLASRVCAIRSQLCCPTVMVAIFSLSRSSWNRYHSVLPCPSAGWTRAFGAASSGMKYELFVL